ncbi:MAG: hypothetical protein CSB01_00770 [Bacteroidia bacterium]|nr:MAG: hypothetical protein CSB01_00770 [Bacteroidia bacterium]
MNTITKNSIYLFLLLFSLFSLFLQSCSFECNLAVGEEVACDMEELDTEEGFYLSNTNPRFRFTKEAIRAGIVAHSGSYSAKLTKELPRSLGFMLKNAKPEEYFQISVWRLSSTQSPSIAVADKKREKILFSETVVYDKDSSGWELIKMDLFIPPQYGVNDFWVFLHTPEGETAYFDDLKIKRIGEKKFPQYAEKPFRLFIDSLEKNQLYAFRRSAFLEGIVNKQNNKWQAAIVFENRNMLKAKTKLCSKSPCLLAGPKLPFRIKITKKGSWKAMRNMILQTPQNKQFVKEWFAHKIYEKEKIITPRYDFIPLSLNEKNLGIYAYEEYPDRQMLEFQNREQGPILHWNDEVFLRYKNLLEKTGENLHIPYFNAAQTLPYKVNKTLRNSDFHKQFLLGQNLMYQFKYQLQKPSEIFEVNKLAKFLALTDLMRSYNMILWYNLRFYYNPITSKLEPIVSDCYSRNDKNQLSESTILGDFEPKNIKNESLYPLYYLFSDTVLLNRYIHYLKKYTKKTFIDSLYNEFEHMLAAKEKLIQKEFEIYDFDEHFVRNSAKRIRDSLPKFVAKVKKNPEYALFDYRTNRKPLYDTIYHESLPEYFVHAFLEDAKPTWQKLSVYNYYPKDIILLGTGSKSKRFTNFFHPEPKLKSFNESERPIMIKTDTSANFLFFMVKGKYNTFSVPIKKWKAPLSKNYLQDLKMRNKMPLGVFYRPAGENKILFPQGKHKVKKWIVIPEGFEVVFEAGAQLNFVKDAGFISFSPVFVQGTKDNFVLFSSSDESGKGFFICNAKQTSVINYAKFEFLNATEKKHWKLKGALNFYESDVEIKNSKFVENTSRQTICLTRCNFMIENCSFVNIPADAVDATYCTGKITNCTCFNVAADGFSFSGSNVGVENCDLYAIGRCGISSRKSSNIGVRNTKIRNSSIGFVAKDLSLIMSFSSELIRCNYGMLVMKKRPEFGPSSIMAYNLEHQGIDSLYLIEKGSIINLNGKTIRGNEKNLSERFFP